MPEWDDPSRVSVLQNVHSTIEFLRRFAPFDHMSEPDLRLLVERCRLAFYAAGEEILTPAHGRVQRLYIIKQGQVRGERPGTGGSEADKVLLLTAGECFPIGAMLGERATRTVHRAVTDTFCYELEREDFATLFTRSQPFREFFLRGVSSLLERVSRQIQTDAVDRLGAQTLLNAPLRQIVRRAPVTCPPHTTVRDAARRMHHHKVGSIVVCDDEQRPLGIFTLHDLLAVMAVGEQDFEQPIERVMTPHPAGLPATASGFDAALLMAQRQFGHVCVLDGERLLGVVSERDLFALQRVDLVHLTRCIGRADDIAELESLRPQIRRLIEAMLAHGADAPQITGIITLLNDHTVARTIELCLARHGDPGFPFTWLAFGSEGRREQTLATDQDNGIYFEPPPELGVERARARLLPLAEAINHALNRLGFPLCKGKVMASNPALCLSGEEWRRRFLAMIDSATPDNLLNSTIYFDLRPIWGPTHDVDAMYRRVLDHAADNGIFLRLLAANALRRRPPLGLIRDFVVSRDGDDADTLDLKLQGLTPFVDGARVLALARALPVTGTLERLRALAEAGAVAAADAEAWAQAFGLIQLLRMRNHLAQSRAGRPLSNRIDPEQLTPLDRRTLKEAFREARRLQRRLEMDYRL